MIQALLPSMYYLGGNYIGVHLITKFSFPSNLKPEIDNTRERWVRAPFKDRAFLIF